MSSLSISDEKPDCWHDWRWQLENSVRSLEDLPSRMLAGVDNNALLEAVKAFPMSISPYYLSLIETARLDDPLLKMAVPSPMELEVSRGLFDDPISELEHSPIRGLIRRYRDRAVLLVSGKCAVNCRHCTRRKLDMGNLRPVGEDELHQIVDYLRDRREIRDVILSGGDPLLLEDRVLKSILDSLREIETVETIRIGSRVPVTLPMRVDEALVDVLSQYKPLFVNTQFNHPREITKAAIEAVSRFVDRGIPVANQAVLLKGVNDSSSIMEELCWSLHRIRVRPYYLFLCDLWNGIEHFRTSIDTGVKIMADLRGRISGLAIPELVADLPGGIGKVPVGPNNIVGRKGSSTLLKAKDGRVVEYPDPEID